MTRALKPRQSRFHDSPPPHALKWLDSPDLKRLSTRLRIDILQMIFTAQSGHPGSSLSCVDIIAALWFARMDHTPFDSDWVDRDRFILSKGHAAPALYAVLMEAGYIDKVELPTLRAINSKLQGHPASKYLKSITDAFK